MRWRRVIGYLVRRKIRRKTKDGAIEGQSRVDIVVVDIKIDVDWSLLVGRHARYGM